MRYPVAHKPQTRAGILAAADRLIRARGLAGASVEKVMTAAGLTVGGFYAHFRSKDELMGATLGQALTDSLRRWLEGFEALRGSSLVHGLVRRYLNRSHRDQPELGCPLATTLGELARAPSATRLVAAEGVEAIVAALARRMEGASDAERRQQAIGVVALCLGGIGLARAVGGSDLSDEVLRACRGFAERAVSRADAA
jgi:TetR/AcrR family transcriptional repressor of nem operon